MTSMQDPTIEGFSLSPQQKTLFRVGSERSASFLSACSVRVEGQLTLQQLTEAARQVVAEHEILRTDFQRLGAGAPPVQTIADARELDVVRLESAEALHGLEETTPFNLEREPGLRVHVVTEGDQVRHLRLSQPALCGDALGVWNVLGEIARVLDGTPLDEEAMQYADLAQWQHDLFESEEAPEGLGFWRKSLGRASAASRLSLQSEPGDPEPLFRCTRRPFEFGALGGEVAELAKKWGLEDSALYAAAWHTLLSRQTEDSNTTLAWASSGRAHEGLSAALGPFQKLLPLALELDSSTTFEQHARATEAAAEAATEWHEFFDLERVDGAPDFLPWAFEFTQLPEDLVGGGHRFSTESLQATTDRYGLALVCLGSPRGVDGSVSYDPQAFDGEAITALVEQYTHLLAACVRSPQTPLAQHGLLCETQKARVLSLAGSVDAAPQAAPLLHEAVARHGASKGEAVAVRAGQEHLTYAQLEARANRLARHLHQAGVRPGQFVGIHMGRSVEMIEAILGVLKAGAAYLPLPLDYPPERLAFMLEDTAAQLMITRGEAGDADLPFAGKRLVLSEERAQLEALDASDPKIEVQPDAPAYVIYTSGSTGKPKGVPITHGNLAHTTAARSSHYRHPVEAYLLLSSFAFDSSVAGIFWTLAQGGTLVLPEDGFEQEIDALPTLIAEHRVTHMLGLPSLYELILDGAQPGQLDSLRTVIVAGEVCPAELPGKHFGQLEGTELHNEYGPTEGTVWSTVHDCSEPSSRSRIPIGRPVPGAQVYVLDANLAPVGFGESGELHIGGPGLTAGYLNRPELNREKFVESDFGRLYKTGDRGRLLCDGNFEFLGRLDHQVKLRGYRIELGEIEAVLGQHPDVRSAAVLLREDTPGNPRLAAYLSPNDGSELDVARLQQHLTAHLPAYMLPSAWTCLDTMPLLPNGKVDRSGLPAPEESAASHAPYEAPRTATEKVMAGIWADLLGSEKVGRADDFFALGGHSILATQVAARVSDLLKVPLPLRSLFENPTVGALCTKLAGSPEDQARLERTAEIVLQLFEMDSQG